MATYLHVQLIALESNCLRQAPFACFSTVIDLVMICQVLVQFCWHRVVVEMSGNVWELEVEKVSTAQTISSDLIKRLSVTMRVRSLIFQWEKLINFLD